MTNKKRITIDDIKTLEDFEYITIKYDPETITNEQKTIIEDWIVSFTGQKIYITYSHNGCYIRYLFDDYNKSIGWVDKYYNDEENKDKYTIIDINDFLNVKPKTEPTKESVTAELQALADELNADCPIDWNDGSNKWTISYCDRVDNLHQAYTVTSRVAGAVYSLNSGFLYIAKKRIGREKLLLLFNVKKELTIAECVEQGLDFKYVNGIVEIINDK